MKQRLVGAVVLVALAVIFLPLLIKGPAPVSGAAKVPLDLPEAPKGEFQTRELPLLTPVDGSPNAGHPEPIPSPSSAPTDELTRPDATGRLPASTAGGDFAVSFGSYATASDATRVVAALIASQLPGYQEQYSAAGGNLHRVRIGPYATRAEAEAMRLRAAHIRDDVGSRVITLDADASASAKPSKVVAADEVMPDKITSEPAAKPVTGMPATRPVTGTKPAAPLASKPDDSNPAASKPAASKPAASQPAASKPADADPVASEPVQSTPAASTPPAAGNVGFAVQIGAFSNAEEATRLRDRARAAGLSAFVEQVPTERGTLSRVRLGPVADRAAAEALRAQAAARLGANGQVRPHP